MSKNFRKMQPHNPTSKEIVHVEDVRHQTEDLFNITQENTLRNTSYTKWSQWSRCENCYQVRMKECLVAKCKHSKIYEERRCDKKRCKRKARQKLKFNIVHLNQVRIQTLLNEQRKYVDTRYLISMISTTNPLWQLQLKRP